MRKRFIPLLLLCALLCACGLKEAVQRETTDALNIITGQLPVASGGSSKPAASEAPGQNGSSERTPATPPPDADYYDRLYIEYLNAPNEGYVWTLEVHDTALVDAMGLAAATYNVNISASHVGEDMYGVYFGEINFDYNADMSGMESLLTAQGGTISYDTDGWFVNDKFMFSLSPYNAEEEEMVIAFVNHGSAFEGMSAEERALMESILGSVYNLDNEKGFEKNTVASAMWWDMDIPMTDGDMSGFFEMSGVMGGITDASDSVDKSGKNVVADARVAFAMYANGALVGTYDERYESKDTFENPLTHTIKVYPDGEAVVTFYSASGGPVTTKCYGTLTKIPVEDTLLMGR